MSGLDDLTDDELREAVRLMADGEFDATFVLCAAYDRWGPDWRVPPGTYTVAFPIEVTRRD